MEKSFLRVEIALSENSWWDKLKKTYRILICSRKYKEDEIRNLIQRRNECKLNSTDDEYND